MAAGNVAAVQYQPGTLAFGGTDIGLASAIRLIPVQRTFPVQAEEYGGKTVEIYELGRDWLVTGVARGKDAAMLNALFSSSVAGSIAEDLADSKGTPGSARAADLVFTPADTDINGFTLHKAIPRVDLAAAIPFSVHDRTAIAFVFQGITDNANSGKDLTWAF